MVADFIEIILGFSHLVGAILWVGTALYMGIIFTPVFNKLEPPVRGAVMRNLIPRQSKILTIAIIITGVTGLLRTFRSPMYPMLMTNTWGWGILLGGGAAVLMALIGFLVIIPTGKKLLKISAAGPPPGAGGPPSGNPPGPPPEIAKLQSRIEKASMTNFILSFVVIFGMTVAG